MSQTWKMSVSFSEHSKSTPLIKKCSWFSAISFGHWFLIHHDVFFPQSSECVIKHLKFHFLPDISLTCFLKIYLMAFHKKIILKVKETEL